MNKIGWCDMTWNPIWGCRNNCEYCYARTIAKRFWKQMHKFEYHYAVKNPLCYVWTDEYLSGLEDFKPTFLESQFNKKLPKKPQRIFVGSMSEIYYWEKEWIERVIEKVKQYPQHTFQFLTKFPEVYSKYTFPKNCWLGITMIDSKSIYHLKRSWTKVRFICIEPILEKMSIENIDFFEPDWVIIGAETGNRKGKVIPELDWIDEIVDYCRGNKIPVYLKDSLKNICPSLWRIIPTSPNQSSIFSYKPIKEFPKEVNE